jgi:hypothetical protein
MRRAILVLLASSLAAAALAQAPAAAPAATPSVSATPAPVIAPVPESPGQSLIEQDESAMSGRSYTYDPAGRRDPFRSLLVREQNRGGVSRPPGIAGIAIDDLVVHGIWKTRSRAISSGPAICSTTARSPEWDRTRSRSGRTSTIPRVSSRSGKSPSSSTRR